MGLRWDPRLDVISKLGDLQNLYKLAKLHQILQEWGLEEIGHQEVAGEEGETKG
jgi:hypothetical protein